VCESEFCVMLNHVCWRIYLLEQQQPVSGPCPGQPGRAGSRKTFTRLLLICMGII